MRSKNSSAPPPLPSKTAVSSHTVTIGEFEGPLGLLLELVEKGNMEVTAISVATITTQYLDRLKQLQDQSPEHLSEFLQLGARLLYIKSLALLPGETTIEHAQEIERLNSELEEYRRFQQLARQLSARSRQRTWERQVTERLASRDLPLPDVSLGQLAAAFSTALDRAKPFSEPEVIPAHMSLETALAKLRTELKPGSTAQALFSSCQNQLEVIVMFLALLELIRTGEATVQQTSQFAPITIVLLLQ